MTLAGCLTPSEKKQMRDDIFSLQTRLVELESGVQAKTKDQVSNDEIANKRLATNNVKVDQINQEIQRIQGDVDALKVGVRTGRLPGDTSRDPAIADVIEELKLKIAEIEENQRILQEEIEKSRSSSRRSASKGKDTAAKTTSVQDIRDMFESKRYTALVSAVEDVIKRVKTKRTKEELVFLNAESLFKLGKMRDAALKFNDLLQMDPNKDRTAHAKMRLGDCFRHLGDKATAKLYYEETSSQFPTREEGKRAKEMLKEL
jgi:hypothetical protein